MSRQEILQKGLSEKDVRYWVCQFELKEKVSAMIAKHTSKEMHGYKNFAFISNPAYKHCFAERSYSGARLLSSIVISDNMIESFANDYKSDSKTLRQLGTSFLIL